MTTPVLTSLGDEGEEQKVSVQNSPVVAKCVDASAPTIKRFGVVITLNGAINQLLYATRGEAEMARSIVASAIEKRWSLKTNDPDYTVNVPYAGSMAIFSVESIQSCLMEDVVDAERDRRALREVIERDGDGAERVHAQAAPQPVLTPKTPDGDL